MADHANSPESDGDLNAFLEDLKSVFLEEFSEAIELIETDLLRLERGEVDSELVQSLFRNFHNIKGSSKTVGYQNLSVYAHKNENILSGIRSGTIQPSASVTETLLKALDVMKEFLTTERDARQGEAFVEGILHTEQPHSDPAHGAADQPLEFRDGIAFNEEALTKHSSHGNAAAATTPADEKKVPPPASAGAASQPAKGAPAGASAAASEDEILKTPLSRINKILDLFGEQVILQSSLQNALNQENVNTDFVKKSLSQMRKITRDLQYTLVSLRMVQLKTLFNRLERSVRDVSRLTGKPVDFIRIGDANELDKSIVDALVDPLTHMVRNSVHHGIEEASQRKASGKPEAGRVTLEAVRRGGHFEVILSDDGAGLNTERILQKAIAAGIVPAGSRPPDSEINRLIFRSGLSTRDQASEISGRGVGMDVVKRQIEKLKGTCSIESKAGSGTRITIRLPLSLAMFNGTGLAVNGVRYVIPNTDYRETVSFFDSEVVEQEVGRRLLRRGDEILQVISLGHLLRVRNAASAAQKDEPTAVTRRPPPLAREANVNQSKGSRSPSGARRIAVVTETDNATFALVVDEILSQQQVVQKKFVPEARQIRFTTGGTILGHGHVALILDTAQLMRVHVVPQSAARAS